MAQDKQRPWLDEFLDGNLFRVASEEIALAISLREQFDYDYGIRFRGEEIRSRCWSVGIVLEKATDDNTPFETFFRELTLLGETELLAIPAKTVHYEFTGTHDVVDLYAPPLIAKTGLDVSSYIKIRSSLVQMIRGSFFLFPGRGQAAVLSNSGRYSMFAGPRELVERVVGTSIDASWNSVRSNEQLDPLVLQRLRPALAAYGLSR